MDHPAAPPPSSTSSPVAQQRKRIIATRKDPPTPLRFGSMAKVMRRRRFRKASSDTRGSGGLGGELRRKRKRRISSMAKVMHRRSRSRTVVHAPPPLVYDDDDDVVCESCGSGDRDDELLLCDRCDRGHHTFCLRPIVAKIPIGPWFCPDCAPPAKCIEGFPMDQTEIDDFFHIQKDDEPMECRLSRDARRRRKSSLVMRKKKRMILPFVPTEDSDRRLKQMASLATALTSSKMEFSNELTYMSNMAPRSSNQARLEEGGIQVLHKEDKETIELCRTMQQRGKCPPLLVVFDSREGFTIQADADIKHMTFIAEFVGDVDYLEKRANDDCDCLMTLLLTADPSQNLVICPDKRGNISRFISSINNHTPDGKKKQNVKCVRYDIDGESRVLLVACRDIVTTMDTSFNSIFRRDPNNDAH